VELLAH